MVANELEVCLKITFQQEITNKIEAFSKNIEVWSQKGIYLKYHHFYRIR